MQVNSPSEIFYFQGKEFLPPIPDSDADDFTDFFCEEFEDNELSSRNNVAKRKGVRFNPTEIESSVIDQTNLTRKRKIGEALSGAFGKYIKENDQIDSKVKKRRACVLCRQEGHDKRNCPLK